MALATRDFPEASKGAGCSFPAQPPGKDFPPGAAWFTAPELAVPGEVTEPRGAAAAAGAALGSAHSPGGSWPEDTSAPPVCRPPRLHPLHSTVLHQHPTFCLPCATPCYFHRAGASPCRRQARGCCLRPRGCGALVERPPGHPAAVAAPFPLLPVLHLTLSYRS